MFVYDRIYVLFEIQKLWMMLPHVYDWIRCDSSNDYQIQKLLRIRSTINSLDRMNFALCDIALKLLTPELEKLIQKEQKSSSGIISANTSSQQIFAPSIQLISKHSERIAPQSNSVNNSNHNNIMLFSEREKVLLIVISNVLCKMLTIFVFVFLYVDF